MGTMIFIISGLNLITNNDSSFAQVNASSSTPISPLSNNNQPTEDSMDQQIEKLYCLMNKEIDFLMLKIMLKL